MSRPSRVRRLGLVALLAAAGCQDYNFNPVGHCVVQPGAARVTLTDISTADVLFVVDDSGSMGGEQAKLATNFETFISTLDAFNADRAATGATPIDFHVAVTTTSVFLNGPSTAVCRADCPSGAGANVCCRMSGATMVGPLKTAKTCQGVSDTATCGADACSDTCTGYLGEFVCCTAAGAPVKTANVSCDVVGDPCGDLQKHYTVDSTCQAGNAVDGGLYPHGSFIGRSTNPRVLHFDKELYPLTDPCVAAGTCVNRQGFTSTQLKTFFEQNVAAGTCGSGEEQALGASQLAVEKASALQQVDYYTADSGTLVPAGVVADWLHPRSKLVLVYVGDEDDCTSPEDATGGVILVGNPGSDACVADQSLPEDQRKETAVSAIVSAFTGLRLPDKTPRPLGAAFIVSTQGTCQDDTCLPGLCCDTACTGNASICSNATCGGQAPGTRLLNAAAQFRSVGDVVVGSICDDFGPILGRIADIVKPPTALTLPTEPAASGITVLRIAAANGKTRKTCSEPAPAGTPLADALASYDWWFTADRIQETDLQKAPTASTRFVYINHLTHNCEASPGETYSADYLGRLPAGGCFGATPKEADDSCVAALGGLGYSEGDSRDGPWTCYAGVVAVDDGTGTGNTVDLCRMPDATHPGTCICGARGGPDATPPLPFDPKQPNLYNCGHGTQM